MAQRRTARRKTGRRPFLVDTDVAKTLVDAIKLGVPVSTACQAADISESIFYQWTARGRDAHENREAFEDGDPAATPFDPADQPYLDLYLEIRKARATAATRNVGLIQKVAQGGSITEETVRTYRDHDTGELVQEKTVKRQAPDWRAAAWYLERSHKPEWGKGVDQVEVTGADGGPIQVAVDAEDLSNRLSKHLAEGIATTPVLPALEAGGSDGDDADDDT